MANGKPGDHPFSDILLHGHSEFGEPVDGIVKALAQHPGFAEVRDEVANILWETSPAFLPVDQRASRVSAALTRLAEVRRKLDEGHRL